MSSSTLVQVINDATLVVRDNTQANPVINVTSIGVPQPVTTVIDALPSNVVVVDIGSQGPPGPAGSGSGNTFVQSSAPVSPPTTYAWFQTLLGHSGHDITLWIEDGT